MSKILVNPASGDVVLADVGVTVAGAASYTIPPQDYASFAASSDTIRALADLVLTLNDGGQDISDLSKAVDIIKGWPIQVDQSSTTTPFFFDYLDVPATGPQTIFEQTVDPGVILVLNRIYVSCRMESICQVYLNGSEIANLRTGAARPTDVFDWSSGRECISGDSIIIVLTKRTGSPDIDVGVHMMGTQQS